MFIFNTRHPALLESPLSYIAWNVLTWNRNVKIWIILWCKLHWIVKRNNENIFWVTLFLLRFHTFQKSQLLFILNLFRQKRRREDRDKFLFLTKTLLKQNSWLILLTYFSFPTSICTHIRERERERESMCVRERGRNKEMNTNV